MKNNQGIIGYKGRSKQKTFTVNGKIVKAVSIAGLAEYLGKSKDTLLRYEKKDFLPPSPLLVKGCRYYPLSMLQELRNYVDTFPSNRPPSPEVITGINKLFKQTIENF